MVFVDTGGWIAVSVASDSLHQLAQTYYEDLLSRRVSLFTSNFVLDETITRIRYDIGHAAACRFWDLYEQAEGQQLVTTFWVDAAVTQKALQIFRKYSDQRFSLTDCSSFVLVKVHSITEAFSFDSHFELVGFIRQPQMGRQE
ncbi:MAG: PIN domain-containing protein [Acidobacteria bacterium]|nr:PIN domain-containing protein [Acidobacteriota bacterium]